LYNIKVNENINLAIKYFTEFTPGANTSEYEKYFKLKDIAGIMALVILGSDIDKRRLTNEILSKPAF